jgi:hypothetical protein
MLRRSTVGPTFLGNFFYGAGNLQAVSAQLVDTGLESSGDFSGKTTLSAAGAAESGAVAADLESLIAA